MLVGMKKLLLQAQKEHYAIPAPDYWDSVSARAFVKAAERIGSPVILSYSPVHRKLLSLEEAAELGRFYAGRVNVPVALHLDHGKDFEMVREAISLGFTSVMIDASALPFEENVRVTREVTEYAHPLGIDVEAEIGHVGAEDENGPHALSASSYTEPDTAQQFVELTGVDAVAVSIGTSHGAYKNGTPHINFDILQQIREKTDVPLVLHGGSGTGDENLRKCAEMGICKINVYTDYITAVLKKMHECPQPTWPALVKQAEETIMEVHEHYDRMLRGIEH